MFTFTIKTNEVSTEFNSKEQAVGATNMLDDMNVKFKIIVKTPNNKEFSFSGLNAWAEISDFFNL